MNNCSEYGCNNKATQKVHSSFGLQQFCDIHFRNKIQIKKSTRVKALNPQTLRNFTSLIQETSSKIILESSQSIKAIKLKTQADLEILSNFCNLIKEKIALVEFSNLKIFDTFVSTVGQEPHFINHFRELGTKLKWVEDEESVKNRAELIELEEKKNQKIKIPKLDRGYAEILQTAVSMPLKKYEDEEIVNNKAEFIQIEEKKNQRIKIPKLERDYAEIPQAAVSMPLKIASIKREYKIQTKDGLKIIPENVVQQIEEARLRKMKNAEIYINGRLSNIVDLVHWKSFKVDEQGRVDTYFYKIHPPKN